MHTMAWCRWPVGSGNRAWAGVARAVLAAMVSVTCSDPVRPETCTEVVAGTCWTYLGPAGVDVADLAELDNSYFAATSLGVLRFDRGTGTWMPAGLEGRRVTSITPISSSTAFVTVYSRGSDSATGIAYLTRDGGRTWQRRDNGLAVQPDTSLPDGVALSSAVDPSNAASLWVGGAASIWRSLDGGQAWAQVYGPSVDRGGGIRALAVSPVSPLVWAGGADVLGYALVLRGTSNGSSWSELRPLGQSPDGIAAVAVIRKGAVRVFLGAWRSIWASVDDGVSWTKVLSSSGLGWVRAFLLEDALLLAAADEETMTLGVSRMRFFLSSDSGLTWQVVPVPGTAAGATALVRTRSATVLTGTHSGVWEVRLQEPQNAVSIRSQDPYREMTHLTRRPRDSVE